MGVSGKCRPCRVVRFFPGTFQGKPPRGSPKRALVQPASPLRSLKRRGSQYGARANSRHNAAMPFAAVRGIVKLALLCDCWLAGSGGVSAEEARGIGNPLHGYWTREPQDRFSRLKAEIESGRLALDTSSEKAALESLLRALEVPASSQTLVYSATSLQKGLINARNPRALYFNDDTYVGYVPGGRIEIASLDPELGGIFYLLDRPREGRPPRALRERNCMNCHAPPYLGEIPALVHRIGGAVDHGRRREGVSPRADAGTAFRSISASAAGT